MNSIIDAATDLPWWKRVAFQVEIVWKIHPAVLTWRQWALNWEGSIARKYHGFSVFWARGVIRIVGFELAAGVFWRGDKLTPAD